ncbi:unnamed protein product [Protopolystoma xenopodis]|uniref:Uncharacterized protein n=1 Tax=Protopolystoma xenopodis TaxID=117903 RepID=A0A3S5BEL7_9PLAT|nr:unnamed protein product [Protopolystoma xenopodis]
MSPDDSSDCSGFSKQSSDSDRGNSRSKKRGVASALIRGPGLRDRFEASKATHLGVIKPPAARTMRSNKLEVDIDLTRNSSNTRASQSSLVASSRSRRGRRSSLGIDANLPTAKSPNGHHYTRLRK